MTGAGSAPGSTTERAGRRRVAITGIGAVTPVGNDASTTWDSLAAGQSGIGPITTFSADTFSVRIAGMVKGFNPLERLRGDARRFGNYLSRAAGFAVAAALEALDCARVTRDTYQSHLRGVSLSGSAGRQDLNEATEMLYTKHASGGRQLFRPAPLDVLRRNQNLATSVVGLLADCQGPMININTACAGSSHSIGEAVRRIQDGEAALMIAGGSDALTTYLDVLGFSLLGALASTYNDRPQQASRPFDRERTGFVIGEGAVVVVLEDLEAAHKRGAPILAEIAGYGSSMNAWRITDSPPDGGGAILAMANALRDAGTGVEAVDYVVAHGTGTAGNDLSETAAIKHVFEAEARRVAISSPKSMTGHLTSAAGALNVLVAVGALRNQVVPPTINLDYPDPQLDLDYVPGQARSARVRCVLVNAFAMGGTNSCLVVRQTPTSHV